MAEEKNNSSFDLAWAAGFIDADGTITIKRMLRKPIQGHPTPHIQYQALVQVGQRNYPNSRKAIEKLQTMFGGYVHPYQPKKGAEMLTWGVVSQKAFRVLELILPFLVLKKDNAEIVIDFHKNKELVKGGRDMKNCLSEDETAWRQQCWIRVRELNKKGTLQL